MAVQDAHPIGRLRRQGPLAPCGLSPVLSPLRILPLLPPSPRLSARGLGGQDPGHSAQGVSTPAGLGSGVRESGAAAPRRRRGRRKERGGLKRSREGKTLRCSCRPRVVGPVSLPQPLQSGGSTTSRVPRHSGNARPSLKRQRLAPPQANGAAPGLVGLLVLLFRRSPATARERTTIPKKLCAAAWLLGVVVQNGTARARRTGAGTTCPRMQRGGRGGRGFERRVSLGRRTASAAAGAGGGDG